MAAAAICRRAKRAKGERTARERGGNRDAAIARTALPNRLFYSRNLDLIRPGTGLGKLEGYLRSALDGFAARQSQACQYLVIVRHDPINSYCALKVGHCHGSQDSNHHHRHQQLEQGKAAHSSHGAATSTRRGRGCRRCRSEEHTSELQSRPHLVCRLLLEKKNKTKCTTKHDLNKLRREI